MHWIGEDVFFMAYRLVEQSGDTLAVPQLVLRHLARTDGDTVRVALYLLNGGAADPQTIAHDLALKSPEAAKRALQYWAGAGLLTRDKALSSADATAPVNPGAIDLASLNDPYVAVLCEEAQNAFGRALSRSEMQRLVGLYLNEGWKPDVLLLCCAEVARQGRRTVAALSRELERWRADNVETGEDAERYLKRQKLREEWWCEAARMFGVDVRQLTRWERGAVVRWHEEWRYGADMVDEALLHAENHRTIRYVDGILRSWRAQGLTTVQAVRGKGQLSGSNILATQRPAAGQTPAATAKKDVFNRDWNAVFDDDAEG